MLTAASPTAPPDLEYMVVLRPGGRPAQDESRARVFASWEACASAGTPPLGFYLDGWDTPAAAELASQIRRSAW
jgi:hypothetical protein